jgi:hypothetical protein
VWTLVALSRLSGIVTDTVRDSEAVTAVTSQLSGALEREDDAVLLVLAGDPSAAAVLARERTVVDKALADLFDVLGPADEQELARPLESALQAYRRAADALAAVAAEREALVQYHERANPLLRRAVALTTVIRDDISNWRDERSPEPRTRPAGLGARCCSSRWSRWVWPRWSPGT